jgi:hypothetical protein
MLDLSRLSQETSDLIFAAVADIQPATAAQVKEELQRRHGGEVALERLVHYMEFLRSAFPKKLAHAGPDNWVVVDLA